VLQMWLPLQIILHGGLVFVVQL